MPICKMDNNIESKQTPTAIYSIEVQCRLDKEEAKRIKEHGQLITNLFTGGA